MDITMDFKEWLKNKTADIYKRALKRDITLTVKDDIIITTGDITSDVVYALKRYAREKGLKLSNDYGMKKQEFIQKWYPYFRKIERDNTTYTVAVTRSGVRFTKELKFSNASAGWSVTFGGYRTRVEFWNNGIIYWHELSFQERRNFQLPRNALGRTTEIYKALNQNMLNDDWIVEHIEKWIAWSKEIVREVLL